MAGFVVILVSLIRHVLCIVDCGLGADCVVSLGWLLLVPGYGLDFFDSLVTCARVVGGVCFPFCQGVGLVIWLGCLVACLWGLALFVSFARCLGLFVFDFVSG